MVFCLFVRADGKKQHNSIIWKSENPRSLNMFNKSDLFVNYFSQSNAWMTGEILNSMLLIDIAG